MIEVKNLYKRYGDFEAVKGINFHVAEGEIVGLLGPNGAGKSTTMNMLTGYLAPTEGVVKIGGYDIVNEPIKAKRLIGYLPEIPPLYKDMTVYEYLRFVRKLKYKNLIGDESIDKAMKTLAITHVKDVLIKQLSKGYQQRVGFAAALIGEPKLLILDEPMVGMDPEQTFELRQIIKSLGGDHTVILSSHILSEISEICDHIIIISNGEVTAQDSTDNLTKKNSDNKALIMTIKGEKDNILSVLNACDLLGEVKISKETEPGVFEIVAESVTDKDVRDDMYQYLMKNQLIAYGIQHRESSLEEVFIKLTAKKEEK